LVVIIGLTIGKHIGRVLLTLLWGVILYALLQIGKEKPIALSPLGGGDWIPATSGSPTTLRRLSRRRVMADLRDNVR